VLAREGATVARLARVRAISILPAGDPAPPGAAGRVAARGECYLERPVASASEREVLFREREKIVRLLEKEQRRLGDAGFRSRAPSDVVAEVEEKARELEERVRRIDEHLKGTDSGIAG
jgi:valyl-tRNA synthetase